MWGGNHKGELTLAASRQMAGTAHTDTQKVDVSFGHKKQ